MDRINFDPSWHILDRTNLALILMSPSLPRAGPPTTRPATNVSVVEGSEASLVCPVAGYPINSVSWTLHGRPLTPTTRRTPSSRSKGRTLKFQSVEADYDVGRYTCTVSDAQGRSATASFFLGVVSKWLQRERESER